MSKYITQPGDRQIQVRSKCSCGNGIIANPAWRGFPWDEYRKASQQEVRETMIQAWFDFKEVPPEEIECPECKGLTWLYEWVPVQTFCGETRGEE